jgi:hypothetical protein
MHDEFAAHLGRMSFPFMIASGSLVQRVELCSAWIDARLREAWDFADPLG